MLIKKAVKQAKVNLDSAHSSNNSVMDAVHDLKMFIDSGGDCEVTKEEAMSLIGQVVDARNSTESNLSECNEWLLAISSN